MRGCRSTFAASVLSWMAALICSLSITAGSASAQQPGPHTSPSGSPDHFAEMRERRQREAELHSIEMRLKETTKANEPDLTLEQAGQDFKRLLVIHNELARNISAGGALDYKIVSEAAGEINKRANRLKKFVVAPDPKAEAKDGEEQAELKGKEMKVALVMLCKRIESFVENPLFNVPGVVDVQASARAGSDLLRIIKLSDIIRRDAGKLNKTPK